MSTGPLVTIITPVLNCAPFMTACLESVLAQSYPRIEHVVADGASTDGTREILEQYAARHPSRVRYTSQPDAGRGAGEAWNRALAMGGGEIFGWLGGDDLLAPGAVARVVRFMEAHRDARFVHGACDVIDEQGRLLRTHRPTRRTFRQIVNHGNPVCFPAAFYRREVVEAVGPVDAYGNDYEYVLRAARLFPLHPMQEPLALFRLRAGGETTRLLYDTDVRRLDYEAARRHGARLLSRNACRYHAFRLARRLRLLDPYYHLVSPIRRWLVHGRAGGAFHALVRHAARQRRSPRS